MSFLRLIHLNIGYFSTLIKKLMFLTNIKLLNFKNHFDTRIEFSSNINCLVGNNGAGKTNVLDAIHYLSFTKSYFSSQDGLNIMNQQPFASIDGVFQKNDEQHQVQCIIKQGAKKVLKRNKKQYQKMAEHIGLFPLVMISPTDSDLLLGGSEVRRKFVDSVIAQFDRAYLYNLISYNKLLQQRNALLKQSNVTETNLELYDEQMAPLAQLIYDKRKSFLTTLNPIFINYYKSIAQSDEEVLIEYKTQLDNGVYSELSKANRAKDLITRFSSVGVHKDDFIMLFDKHLIKRRGSQGQQKTFLLALKLAQFDFMSQALKFKPILLLDDIFDKLDDNRVEHLMTLVDKHHFGQIFVTDTHSERSVHIFDKINADYKLFQLNNGGIS